MKIDKGNIWTYDTDWRIIFTNGFVKRDGTSTMGRGTAYQAKKRYPKIAYALGQFLNNHGNHVAEFIFKDDETGDEVKLLTMPTKHHWIDKADLYLIEQSALELASLPYSERFVMGKPGCGNGGLDWAVVKPVIEKILDDRFTVLE